MTREQLSIEDWQHRLESNFSESGVVGGSLLALDELEANAGQLFC